MSRSEALICKFECSISFSHDLQSLTVWARQLPHVIGSINKAAATSHFVSSDVLIPSSCSPFASLSLASSRLLFFGDEIFTFSPSLAASVPWHSKTGTGRRAGLGFFVTATFLPYSLQLSTFAYPISRWSLSYTRF